MDQFGHTGQPQYPFSVLQKKVQDVGAVPCGATLLGQRRSTLPIAQSDRHLHWI